jgi:hypothetical protein
MPGERFVIQRLAGYVDGKKEADVTMKHWVGNQLVDEPSPGAEPLAMSPRFSLHAAASPRSQYWEIRELGQPGAVFLSFFYGHAQAICDLLNGAFNAGRAAGDVARPPLTCRVCGCTDDDCSGCIERTGEPCSWAEPGLCTACKPTATTERIET